VRYGLIGIWNTVFGLAVFAAANATIGHRAGYVTSLTVMFALAIPQAHLAQRLLVWHSHAPYLPELIRFSGVFVVAYVVNLVLLSLAVEVLGAPTLASQVVISGLIAVSTFFIHRGWTFRRHPTSAGDTSSPVLAWSSPTDDSHR
jgi:putative flippase GtrA